MAFPTDQTLQQPGQINNAGDSRALFEKLFAGEVLTEFHNQNIMMGKTRTKTIKSGSSYSFPMVGTAGAKTHTPGQLIEGDQIAHSERKVTIDDLSISPVFIPNIQEAMNHWDVRSIYSKECGLALAELTDRNILRTACKAAFITDATAATAAGLTPVTGETFTSNIMLGAANDELDGSKLVAAIFAAAKERDSKNVGGNWAIFLRPAQYYALFNTTDVNTLLHMNKDVGGEGSYANASVPKIAGMPVYMTNHLPSTDESTTLSNSDPTPLADTSVGSGRDGYYKGDYQHVVGLVMNTDAVATVKLFDLSTEMEYQINRQGTLVVAKMAVGHNVLRPAGAIAIEKNHV